MHKIATLLMTLALLIMSVGPATAQRDRGGRNRNDNARQDYYNGMNQGVRGGNYDQRYSQYDQQRRRDNNNGGGIGPGYGALIGGGGGAVLGALFGGGLKGTLIGGAAGAGLGALGGKLAQGNNNNNNNYRRRPR